MFTQIEVHGPDSRTFLQAQLTQDVARVSTTSSPLAAWCTPQGRVVVVVRLIELPDGIGLVVPSALASRVLPDLGKYRLRAKVELRQSGSTWQSLAIADEDGHAVLDSANLMPDRETNSSRQRGGVATVRLSAQSQVVEVYGELESLRTERLDFSATLSPAEWTAARLAAGIPDIGAGASGRFTPHMLNLDRLGAVSFDKGCYTGQEVIARTQHLGHAKRRLLHYTAEADVAAGDVLERDGRAVGEVVTAAGREFLALLASDAQGSTIEVGGQPASPADED